ncbi:dimethylaniline monooxygenase (N-oxide forming) [Geosmithia morbida]|uniref:Dimethylaniline monooxygenase (N-oxide forming) n=1 Tax=Geosmithia morbida TaxID=1094350 RepID=A0A9P5D704_9HYPO|nr:dimethylaniline monooxygenase (N-oxide forming) [Geosmithia morbida]KAF4126106.1 dimethylaniline monooxygenase (N-oxide forming) [Geosmithia morbida]
MGIVAVKNLVEEGFDVTGTPSYCSAKEIERYLENYVDRFDLRSRFRLSTAVKAVTYQDDAARWRLEFFATEGEGGSPSSVYFDRVVMATGPHAEAVVPELQNAQHFSGQMIHARAFKTPEDYKDKHVVLVGLGNSSSDIADALCHVAASVSISHHRGAIVLPRHHRGLPISRLVTQRRIKTQDLLQRYLPGTLDRAVSKSSRKMMSDAFGHPDPAWRLDPAPSLAISPPIVSDTIVPQMRSGAVQSVAAIDRISGPSELTLADGTAVRAEAVIFCTGYRNGYAMLDRRFDPAASQPEAWTAAPGSKGRPLLRLYQNVFSLHKPDSLAFLGTAWFATGAFCIADLASMCIAQVWAGRSPLPSPPDMERWADAQQERLCALARRGTPVPAAVPQLEWLTWADETMGAGVIGRLGWGCKGWSFWWRDRAMWSMLMDGVLTSSMWRLFDEGKRKPWDGARETIIAANAEADSAREGRVGSV